MEILDLLMNQKLQERPILADSRSLASSSERQLLGKLPFRIEISVAIADPKPMLETKVSKAASCPI